MFIAGEPISSATKRLAGRAQMSFGVPNCSTCPSRITAMQSPSVITSIWACVT